MPGFAVTTATSIACLHQGRVTITPHQFRVLAGGSPVVTINDLATVAACALSSANPPSPCVTTSFALAGSSRVLVDGQPVVLEPLGTGAGLCESAAKVPQGTPVISAVQSKVAGA